MIELLLRFGIERFPYRAQAGLRRQDSFRRRPGKRAIAGGTYQRPHKVLAMIRGQQSEHARGFILTAAAGANQFFQEQHSVRLEIGQSVLSVALPPLVSLVGHHPSQPANCFSVGKALKSAPASVNTVCAVRKLPLICAQSIPVMRHNSAQVEMRRSHRPRICAGSRSASDRFRHEYNWGHPHGQPRRFAMQPRRSSGAKVTWAHNIAVSAPDWERRK